MSSKKQTRLFKWLRLYRAGKLDAHWTALLMQELHSHNYLPLVPSH